MGNTKWNEIERKLTAEIEALQARHLVGKNKALKWGLFIGLLIFVFLDPLSIVMLLGIQRPDMPPVMYHIIFFLICMLGPWLGFRAYYRSKDNQQYKSTVVPRLVAAVCPGATYSAKGTIPVKLIQDAHLYDTGRGQKYDNEDTVRGKVGRTSFVYGEVELYHMQSNAKSVSKVVDFKGFLFDADFNKNFQGITILSSDYSALADHVGFFTKLKRCKLEDVRFEKKFRTYTTNDQEARYILTPALQQRILEMNEMFRRELHDRHLAISFHHDHMTIMVPSTTDRFEVKYNMEGVKKDFLALSMMVDIVEQMNLNLRIWTKE